MRGRRRGATRDSLHLAAIRAAIRVRAAPGRAAARPFPGATQKARCDTGSSSGFRGSSSASSPSPARPGAQDDACQRYLAPSSPRSSRAAGATNGSWRIGRASSSSACAATCRASTAAAQPLPDLSARRRRPNARRRRRVSAPWRRTTGACSRRLPASGNRAALRLDVGDRAVLLAAAAVSAGSAGAQPLRPMVRENPGGRPALDGRPGASTREDRPGARAGGVRAHLRRLLLPAALLAARFARGGADVPGAMPGPRPTAVFLQAAGRADRAVLLGGRPALSPRSPTRSATAPISTKTCACRTPGQTWSDALRPGRDDDRRRRRDRHARARPRALGAARRRTLAPGPRSRRSARVVSVTVLPPRRGGNGARSKPPTGAGACASSARG